MIFLRACKKIICKLCGKARWLLLAFVVLFGFALFADLYYPTYHIFNGVSDENGTFLHEYHADNYQAFSINRNGDAALRTIGTRLGAFWSGNMDSGEQKHAGLGILTDQDSDKTFYYYPYYFAIADNGDLYAMQVNFYNDSSSFCSRESVICLSSDYKLKDKVFSIEYRPEDRVLGTDFSHLHYYDGHVTLASVKASGTTLYSIDTSTGTVASSNVYPTDPDGTYTLKVIPVDDAFLFVRSDGNVYRTRFNEPLGESIYRFETKKGSDHPYFRDAVLSDGKIYLIDDTDTITVYLLENGSVTKAFDLKDFKDPGKIVGIYSYRPSGSSHDAIVVSTEHALVTYSDGRLQSKDIVVRPHFTPLMYITYAISNFFILLPLIGLIINLIIRKKTILYKQLIITLPTFLILTIIIARTLYSYIDTRQQEDIKHDISMVCELAADSFDGYDFSELTETNEKTGAAYAKVMDKLKHLTSNHDDYWSLGYLFSIVCKTDDALYLIAEDGSVTLPMISEEMPKGVFPDKDSMDSSRVYLNNQMGSLLSITDSSNSLSAYGKINDKDQSGKFYVKVEADFGILFTNRTEIYYKFLLYSSVIITVLTALLILSMLNITRVIKKVTNTVKNIADGDLTSRINYKSKDELGEISSQVNEMAVNLEKSFEEKDRTEKFYYKFVPEKFREYLSKESFTDLALGDASSRELTVLFCDIRAFSINSEIMTTKENFAFVNTIYGKAGPIIREHNGFVDKYIGDAVMALFENADDAVKCGIDLYRAIVLDPETAKELKVSDINIGIGIHTGMAMIGIVGESERLSGTVISDTVNLSSRLESLTKQYKTAILVSKDTIDRLSDPDSLGLRYLGMIQVAGVNEVKGVYEVLDCLQEDIKKVRSENCPEFREAVRLFQMGRRDDARKALEKIDEEGRSDYVSKMYLDYIKGLSADDKSNVFRFTRK